MVWTGLVWLRIMKWRVLFERGNELTCSIKCYKTLLSFCAIDGFSRRTQLEAVGWSVSQTVLHRIAECPMSSELLSCW
jgi:hypothetical protein